jgi:hypothetical protein
VKLFVANKRKLLDSLTELQLVRPPSNVLLGSIEVLRVIIAAHVLIQLFCALTLKFQHQPTIIKLSIVAACEPVLHGFLTIEISHIVFVCDLAELHVVTLGLHAHHVHTTVQL